MKSIFFPLSFLLDPINTNTHGEREKERCKHAKRQEEREKKKKKKKKKNNFLSSSVKYLVTEAVTEVLKLNQYADTRKH